jgi:two-component system, sensor histidine kinase PdtaS
MVLTELLQNALQHGLGQRAQAIAPPNGNPSDSLLVTAMRRPEKLTVMVADGGAGLPRGFDLDATTSLGLQIVRTLVVTELGGNLEITNRPGGGTLVVVDLPVDMPAPFSSPRDGAGAG